MIGNGSDPGGGSGGAHDAATKSGPPASERNGEPENHAESHDKAPEPYLVLIVEDEEPIAEAVAYVVQARGYTPLVAVDGQQALHLTRERWPALVITDLMMPRLDGVELIAALRADAAANHHVPPPVIVTTAAGMRRAEAAGADAILRKPFDLVDLEDLLHRFLGPAGPSGNARAAGTPGDGA
ncbi:MAG TPA: response regulator [Ktedonobacterales bacterium]